jgi:hypothetical protein
VREANAVLGAIFSVVSGILLEPLPFLQSEPLAATRAQRAH